MSGPTSSVRRRMILGALLLLVIAAGLGSRRYGDALPDFVAANAGDLLWTVAVYLTLAILAPTCSPVKLGLSALAISFAVEFSQLIDVAWLNAIRKTLPGRLLLGAGFLGIDLLRYLAGAVIATLLDEWFTRRLKS